MMEPSEDVIFKPETPYVGVIPGGLSIGKSVIVKGIVKASREEGFSINLCCGLLVAGDTRDNIALHVNPRFHFSDSRLVLNTLIDNKWTREVTHPNPLNRGDYFEVRILVLPDGYNIGLNGLPLAVFPHRVSFQAVKTLYIVGCAEVDLIQFDANQQSLSGSRNSLSNATASLQSFRSENDYDSASASDGDRTTLFLTKPAVPLIVELKKGLKVGSQIYVTGRPFKNAYQFEIDFKVGDDYAFHFNPRFRAKTVVRNCFRRGKWEEEELQAASFPFVPSGTFDVSFSIVEQGYQVAVNGQHFIFYQHRYPIDYVNQFVIEGDLVLQQVRIT